MSYDTERERRANQKLVIINEFRERGFVDVADMLRRGITRTAGYIWVLRREWGPDSIVTERAPGEVATYHLVREPATWVTPRKRRAKRGWYCTTCGQRTLAVDTRLSPSLGRSSCDTCRAMRMFRLAQVS